MLSTNFPAITIDNPSGLTSEIQSEWTLGVRVNMVESSFGDELQLIKFGNTIPNGLHHIMGNESSQDKQGTVDFFQVH